MVDGAGSVTFAVTLVVARKKTNSSSASGCVRRIAAVVVAEFEQRRADLQALGAFHEPAPIGAAAKLAVGRDFEPDLFLHADRGADAVVLNARELVVRDLVAGVAPERPA